MNKKALGKVGERQACRLLKKQGYRILDTNYRSRLGEIDIVALDQNTLVFIEVKTRTVLSFGQPEEGVNLAKQRKLQKLASQYLVEKKFADIDYRFDIIGILINQTGKVKHIELIKNAF